jgi:hypothetical protein
MRYFWLSVTTLAALAIVGGYLDYGASGALAVAGAIGVILFAVWVYRTA